MPWWLGILIGLIGYVAIRHDIGWYLASSHSPVLAGIGRMSAAGAYAPLAWMLLIGCWLWNIGNGGDGSPYGQLMAVTGVAYIVGVAVLRRRG